MFIFRYLKHIIISFWNMDIPILYLNVDIGIPHTDICILNAAVDISSQWLYSQLKNAMQEYRYLHLIQRYLYSKYRYLYS